ncbi:MAG: hypothetical protein JWQ79_2505 [Mucilaginibacter sp.]|nr:hypothetical protein [Mucilaginibacter sp.]
MEEFYIDVELSQVITRIQVDEILPEQWDIPYNPQFIIEFHTGHEFITLTLQLENGKWFDRNTRVSTNGFYQRYFDLDAEALNINYHSPLTDTAIQKIGEAISRHMVIHLTAYMGLFVPVFREPTLN